MHTAKMIATHPDVRGSASKLLVECIDECHACAQACLSCADACLAEDQVNDLRQCIRLNLDCADICDVTAKLVSRRTGADEELIADILEVCAAACERCAEECFAHAEMHAHCRICADACDTCAASCRSAIGGVGSGEGRHAGDGAAH